MHTKKNGGSKELESSRYELTSKLHYNGVEKYEGGGGQVATLKKKKLVLRAGGSAGKRQKATVGDLFLTKRFSPGKCRAKTMDTGGGDHQWAASTTESKNRRRQTEKQTRSPG